MVIGAGSTGTNVAGYARDNDLSVAVVESGLVGGECSYWACIPSKALLGPVHAVAAARRLDGAAAAVTGELDPAAVFARRDEFVSHYDDSAQAEWLESVGATLVRGRAQLTGERRVDVTAEDGGVRTVEAERAVVIATGSRPMRPPIEGLDQVATWDSRDVTAASEVPRRLAVLGGGVVGCEMAQAYARLGAEVTIIERSDRVLDGYAPEVAEIMGEAFDEDGISIRTGVEASAVSRDGETGPLTVTLDGGDDTVVVDELLVAVGRRFDTGALGLEAVGCEPDGPLHVDDRLRVTDVDGGWLYAVGDVNGRALLTHQGKYQARCVADTIAGRDVAAMADERAVPQVVFTDPEVAAVGVSESDASDEHRVVEVAIDSVAAASLAGRTAGRAALVIDEDDVVVGASFVGPAVGEVLHSATIAIMGRVPVETLWHAVPSFPTVSEVWLRLLEADRGVGS